MPGANDKPRRRSTFPPRWAAALLFYTDRLGSAHLTPVRRPGPPALAATVDRSLMHGVFVTSARPGRADGSGRCDQ